MAEVTVRIRKGEEIREKMMEFEDLSLVDFMFADGNYACDCNRSIFFGDAECETAKCSSDIYAVEVVHDGKVIYSDF